MTDLNRKILEMIRKSEGHLSAEDAFLLAKKQNIDVSVASIYRILGKLADEGYIKRINVPGGTAVFDKTIEEHEHLICSICGKVKDLHIKDFKETVKSQTGIDFESYELCLKYICDDCRKKMTEKQ